MKRKICYGALFVFVLFDMESFAFDASFSCSKAKYKVEKLICSDGDLSDLDHAMGSYYNSTLQKLSGNIKDNFHKNQKKWINKRNRCLNETTDSMAIDCMAEEYKRRIKYFQDFGKAMQNCLPLADTLIESYAGDGLRVSSLDDRIEPISDIGPLLINKIFNENQIKSLNEYYGDIEGISIYVADLNRDGVSDYITEKSEGTMFCKRNRYFLSTQKGETIEVERPQGPYYTEGDKLCWNDTIDIVAINEREFVAISGKRSRGRMAIDLFHVENSGFGFPVCSMGFDFEKKHIVKQTEGPEKRALLEWLDTDLEKLVAARKSVLHDPAKWKGLKEWIPIHEMLPYDIGQIVNMAKYKFSKAIFSPKKGGHIVVDYDNDGVKEIILLGTEGSRNRYIVAEPSEEDIEWDEKRKEFVFSDKKKMFSRIESLEEIFEKHIVLQDLSKWDFPTSYDTISKYNNRLFFFMKGDDHRIYTIQFARGDFGWRPTDVHWLVIYKIIGTAGEERATSWIDSKEVLVNGSVAVENGTPIDIF